MPIPQKPIDDVIFDAQIAHMLNKLGPEFSARETLMPRSDLDGSVVWDRGMVFERAGHGSTVTCDSYWIHMPVREGPGTYLLHLFKVFGMKAPPLAELQFDEAAEDESPLGSQRHGHGAITFNVKPNFSGQMGDEWFGHNPATGLKNKFFVTKVRGRGDEEGPFDTVGQWIFVWQVSPNQ